MVNLMHCVNPSYIYWQLTSAPYVDTLHGVLFNKLGWGNSVFKIEGEGGGPSYLKRTTDSEFPRTFDFIPYLFIVFFYLHLRSFSNLLSRSELFLQFLNLCLLCLQASLLPNDCTLHSLQGGLLCRQHGSENTYVVQLKYCILKMQLEVGVSPPANIMTFRPGLTHLTFDLDPCDL